jgi:hypothetical protein
METSSSTSLKKGSDLRSRSVLYTDAHVPCNSSDVSAPFPSSRDIFSATYGFNPEKAVTSRKSSSSTTTLEKLLQIQRNPNPKPLELMFARERAVAQMQSSGRQVFALAPLAPKPKLRPQGPPPMNLSTPSPDQIFTNTPASSSSTVNRKRPLPSSSPPLLNVSFDNVDISLAPSISRANSAKKAVDAAALLMNRSSNKSFGNLTMASDRTALSQRMYAPTIAEARETAAMEEELRKQRHDAKIRCSFNTNDHCRFGLATRQCFGCKVFDLRSRTGYMCEYCWTHRHPWHRIKHDFVFLHQEPDTPPKKSVKNEVAEQVQREAHLLIKATQASALSMGAPLQGSQREEQLKKAAGTCDSLIERVAGLILRLRDDEFVRRERAAALIQRLQRRKWGRKFATQVARLSWGKVYDPGTGLFYYVHRSNRSRTQWDQPTLFGRLIDVKELPERLAFEMSEHEAAVCIQNMVRNIFVKRMIKQLALSAFRRSIDKATGRVFYYNMNSRVASWTKPKSLGDIEPPFYNVFEDDRAIQTACKLVQNTWRKHKAKKIFLRLVAESFEKVWDPSNGRYFYYSRNTGESRWTKPFALLLGANGIKDEDIPEAPPENETQGGLEFDPSSSYQGGGGEGEGYYQEDTSGADENTYTSSPNRFIEPISKERAEIVLENFFRMWRARRALIRELSIVWNRVFDAEYSAYFYFNTVTGESTWYKPKILKRLGIELPVTEEDEYEEDDDEEDEQKDGQAVATSGGDRKLNKIEEEEGGGEGGEAKSGNVNEKTLKYEKTLKSTDIESKSPLLKAHSATNEQRSVEKVAEGENDDNVDDDDRATFLTANEDDDVNDVGEREALRHRFDLVGSKSEDTLGPLMQEREMLMTNKSLSRVNSNNSNNQQSRHILVPPPSSSSENAVSTEVEDGQKVTKKTQKKKSSSSLIHPSAPKSDKASSAHSHSQSSSMVSAKEATSSLISGTTTATATPAAAGGGLRAVSYLSSKSASISQSQNGLTTSSPPRVQRPTSASTSGSLITAITKLSNESSSKQSSFALDSGVSTTKSRARGASISKTSSAAAAAAGGGGGGGSVSGTVSKSEAMPPSQGTSQGSRSIAGSSLFSGVSGSIGSSASRTLAPSDALRIHWRRLQSFTAHHKPPQGGEKMYTEDELLRRFKRLGTRIWASLCEKFGKEAVTKFMVGLTYLESPYAFPGPGWRPVVSKSRNDEEKNDGEGDQEEEEVFFAQQLTARTEMLATPRGGETI